MGSILTMHSPRPVPGPPECAEYRRMRRMRRIRRIHRTRRIPPNTPNAPNTQNAPIAPNTPNTHSAYSVYLAYSAYSAQPAFMTLIARTMGKPILLFQKGSVFRLPSTAQNRSLFIEKRSVLSSSGHPENRSFLRKRIGFEGVT